MGRRMQVLSLVTLILQFQFQWQLSQGAGLRGGELVSVVANRDSPGGTLLIQPPTLVPLKQENPPLLCPHHGHDNQDIHCPSGTNGVNQTTPVCQYDPQSKEYNMLCLRSFSDTVVVPDAHPKSYCGPCRACFQDKEELQAAVNQYKSYTHVNVELAERYGWPIGRWCTDHVTSFANLFFKKSKFNEDINEWETSQVTDMTSM